MSLRIAALVLALMLSLLSAGCATAPATGTVNTTSVPSDPWQAWNRKVFAFNEAIDEAVLKPAAQAYRDVVPALVRRGVGNFFGNIGDIWIGVNNLLQGKVTDGLSDGGRVLVNSTVGIFGLFDIATELGLEKHDEDLGQTLGKWGIGDGPYLVLPLLGPSNVRDTFGLIGDLTADPVWQVEEVATRNSLTGLRFVSKRAQLLGADTTAEQAALDKYGYLRSFYIQYRLNQVYDGQPPRVKDPDDDEASGDDGATAPQAAPQSDKKENQE